MRRKLNIPAGAVTVCLVTNAQMARWNEGFRKKKGPTDVLSFPSAAPGEPAHRRRRSTAPTSREARVAGHAVEYPFTPSASPSYAGDYLGDIAIAPAVARVNARRFGRAFSDELRILILHGAIHLMGYDHETDEGEMDRFEQTVRRSLGLGQP